MPKTILEVKNLSVSYNSKEKILDKVSFEIKEGELISLIGLNGTGKSTLLKTLIGQIKPSSGQIIKKTENIFYIPQKSDLDTSFPLTVEEFCKLFGGEKYPKFLEEVGMKIFEKHKVSTLSGGEFQRVLIAIALSKKPHLLLLDEPTAGVDVSGEKSFYKLISQICQKYQMAIILVSHDIHLVIKNSDKVLCLAGHLCCTGSPQEVSQNQEFKEIFGEHLQPYVHKHDHSH